VLTACRIGRSQTEILMFWRRSQLWVSGSQTTVLAGRLWRNTVHTSTRRYCEPSLQDLQQAFEMVSEEAKHSVLSNCA
jgi:hypothetical protein